MFRRIGCLRSTILHQCVQHNRFNHRWTNHNIYDDYDYDGDNDDCDSMVGPLSTTAIHSYSFVEVELKSFYVVLINIYWQNSYVS